MQVGWQAGYSDVGDEVTILPSGFTSKIKSIDAFSGELREAFAQMSVVITLEDDFDLSRGDMLAKTNNLPEISQEFDVMICWLNRRPSQPKAKYVIIHAANEQKALIKEVVYKIDINSFNRNTIDKELSMNDIGRVTLKTTKPLMIDPYRKNRITGSMIMLDERTNETVAACMAV